MAHVNCEYHSNEIDQDLGRIFQKIYDSNVILFCFTSLI